MQFSSLKEHVSPFHNINDQHLNQQDVKGKHPALPAAPALSDLSSTGCIKRVFYKSPQRYDMSRSVISWQYAEVGVKYLVNMSTSLCL